MSNPELLITGFGPFGDIEQNPSERVARSLDPQARVLDVSFPKVLNFCLSEQVQKATRILCLGVSARATEVRYELIAKNQVGSHPGYDGKFWGRSQVIGNGPKLLAATLVPTDRLAESPITKSHDAGDYLCNFILYQLLRLYPEKQIGFVHIPPFEVVSFEQQLESLEGFIDWLRAR